MEVNMWLTNTDECMAVWGSSLSQMTFREKADWNCQQQLRCQGWGAWGENLLYHRILILKGCYLKSVLWPSPFANVIRLIGLLMALLIGLLSVHECGPCLFPMQCFPCSDCYAAPLLSSLLQAMFSALLVLLCMSASYASYYTGQWMSPSALMVD